MPEYIFEMKHQINEYTCNLPEKINGELIRCKDCKNYLQMDCPMGVLHWNAPPKDGYCYKAVRATNDNVDCGMVTNFRLLGDI